MMSSMSGTIEEIFVEDSVTKARVTVAKKSMAVNLLLLRDARVGDEITIGAGIALATVKPRLQKGDRLCA